MAVSFVVSEEAGPRGQSSLAHKERAGLVAGLAVAGAVGESVVEVRVVMPGGQGESPGPLRPEPSKNPCVSPSVALACLCEEPAFPQGDLSIRSKDRIPRSTEIIDPS